MEIPGFGKAKYEVLAEANIYNYEDILNTFPYDYDIVKISKSPNEQGSHYLNVTIKGISKLVVRNKRSFFFMRLESEGKSYKTIVFNQPYLHNMYYKNEEVLVKLKNNKDIWILESIEKGHLTYPKIIPLYKKFDKISRNNWQNAIKTAFMHLEPMLINDPLPQKIIEKRNLLSLKELYYYAHFPKNVKDVKQAKIRLLYQMFFEMQNNLILNEPSKLVIDLAELNNVGFNLTPSQINAINGIAQNIAKGEPFHLVQGDVGSGKTIIGYAALIAFHKLGKQSLFVTPTTILAHQQYNKFIKLFPQYADNVILITSTSKKITKLKKRIESEENLIVFSSHIGLKKHLNYCNLGCQVIDEQQRFGVQQRNELLMPGIFQIMLTATPIPQTLVNALFSNFSVYKIERFRESQITTNLVLQNDQIIQKAILQTLEAKQKILVVGSRIEDDEELDLKAIIDMLQKINHNLKFGVVTSKTKNEEKNIILEKVEKDEINCLVGTTVLEVGIDIKSAGLILVFDAYRYGLSQLHQIRGRVGRNNKPARCILIVPKQEQITERLEFLTETNDGFLISQKDLELRGPGDIFGTRQSGSTTFDIQVQNKIMQTVQKDYKEYYNENSN